MSDLIKRLEGHIETLRGVASSVYSDDIREAVDALELVTRWIPVSERLPEPHTHFLALNRNGYVFESAMCYGMHKPWFTYPRGDGNASNTAPDWIDVTHWMPKPELPQSAGD